MNQVHQGVQATAQVIEYTINQATNKPLITILVSFPRFVHSELMTHRVFSRNASSSRAIPVKRMIEDIKSNPAFFVSLGMNQPGMQPGEELPQEIKDQFQKEWLELMEINARYAEKWALIDNIHKSAANRVLEPWMRMKVVITATEWDNFYELRDHHMAQAEIQDLARTMKAAVQAAKPRYAPYGNMGDPRCWHLPFISMEERKNVPLKDLIRASVARCARTSYNNHDNSSPDLAKDIELHDRLVVAEPMHASPAEHQACTVGTHLGSGNFTGGWAQYRKLLEKKTPQEIFAVMENAQP